MTEQKIDHAAEAMKTAEQVLSYGEYGQDAGAVISMLSAQVHATLALVEQQRIANIISLHRHEVQYDVGGSRSYLYRPGSEELLDDIQEGLGLS